MSGDLHKVLFIVVPQNIKVGSGDVRSPVFEMYMELEFLQVRVQIFLQLRCDGITFLHSGAV